MVGSLYVHVPFCVRKCDYCAFYSEPGSDELTGRYVAALVRELERKAPLPQGAVAAAARTGRRTVYFGGGTPTLLGLAHWQTLFDAMGRLGLLGAEEWTVECNPATLSSDKARLLRDHGVNRVSLGIQSLDDRLLERLGRVHTREMACRSFDVLRTAGFENLNVDLMFAIPGQTLESWRRTLTEAAALESEHLSCYEVTYEEDTPLYRQLQAGRVDMDEDLAAGMYEELITAAEGAGFRQYEIANFARAGAGGTAEVPVRACWHNVNYWRGGAFVGAGPAATSYVGGVRSKNLANTARYCDLIERGESAVESEEQLPPLGRAGETAAFGLRMTKGWEFDEFLAATGFDLRQEWAGEMRRCVETGWGQMDVSEFRLTRLGLRFADAVAEMFLR